MNPRFWVYFACTVLLTATGLGGIGWFVSKVSTRAPRERFVTPAFELQLAPGWSGEREGSEYFLHLGKPPYRAVAIIAMKHRSVDDTLEAYSQVLRQSQSLTNSNGTVTQSEVLYVRRRVIGRHDWVDSLHRNSEVKDYVTYYMATTTAQLGILVTFSVREADHKTLLPQLDQMMGTLMVYQRDL